MFGVLVTPRLSGKKRQKSKFFDFLLTSVAKNRLLSPAATQTDMPAIEINLRDLPADVQDILRNRAIAEHRPIADVVREYVTESARLILATAQQEGGRK